MYIVKNIPLYEKVAQKIIEIINQGGWQDNILPSEEHLAKMLGVSRPTIREALAELTSQGVVSKKQGLGNIIMPSALQAKLRIDLKTDFIDMLSEEGYEVALLQSYSRNQRLNLNGHVTEDFYIYDEYILADKEVAVALTMYIPHNLFNKEVPVDLPKRNMFSFIADYTGEIITHSVVHFKPALAGGKLGRVFKVKKEDPVLYWREVFYNIKDKKICYTEIHFNPHIMNLTMLRKSTSTDVAVNCPCLVCEDIEKQALKLISEK